MFLKVQGKIESPRDWWVFECYKIHYHEEWLDMRCNKVTPYVQCTETDRNSRFVDFIESMPSRVKDGEEDESAWTELDWDFASLLDNVNCNPRPVIVANLETEQDQEYTVVFDTIAYLCNDKGETIEKITL